MQVAEVIDALTSSLPSATRVKLWNQNEPSAWSQMFILPVPGYIEISAYGPVPKREIEGWKSTQWKYGASADSYRLGTLIILPPFISNYKATGLSCNWSKGLLG